jgi:hypothetical protein
MKTERERNEIALCELSKISWAQPLLREIERRGGLQAPASFFFEARVAFEIHVAGFQATYEFSTDVGALSVDFRIKSDPVWLLELVSPLPHASREEESQMKKFAGVLSDKAAKFPIPAGQLHCIMLDCRHYLYGMGNKLDWRQIAYGPTGVPSSHDWALHNLPTGPIRGPFDPQSPVESAALFKEKIHFISFINERSYLAGELRSCGAAYHLPNPRLFANNEAAAEAFRSFPLRPV